MHVLHRTEQHETTGHCEKLKMEVLMCLLEGAILISRSSAKGHQTRGIVENETGGFLTQVLIGTYRVRKLI